MRAIFFDTETNSKNNPNIIQLTIIEPQNNIIFNEYYKPKNPIDFWAMSIHHITNEKISEYKEMEDFTKNSLIFEFFNNNYLIAHNINFDLDALKNDNIIPENCKIIDTLKVSKIILQDLENPPEAYNLQYLRYYLWINWNFNPHDSLDDVKLLIEIFNKLYESYIKNIEYNDEYDLRPSKSDFLDITHKMTIEPMLIKKLLFWKHIWKEIKDVPTDYLIWLLNSELSKPEKEQNSDMVFTLKQYI